MSAFSRASDELRALWQRFGRDRGRLAVLSRPHHHALSSSANTASIAPASATPPSLRWPPHGSTQELTNAKELIPSVMEELRKLREATNNGFYRLSTGITNFSAVSLR